MLSCFSCGAADGETAPAVVAAGAARRWLARNAARVKAISNLAASALACTSLVVCLPSLERVELCLPGPLFTPDLGCLLEALAWCPHLRALHLEALDGMRYNGGGAISVPSLGFAKLRSLTKLELGFGAADTHSLGNVVYPLVSLTDLAELHIDVDVPLTRRQPAVVPAALGQLKALQSLRLCNLTSCSFEAGCLDLPSLWSLEFQRCKFKEAAVLPGVSTLQSLSRIAFSDGYGPRFFDAHLVQLPQLQRAEFKTDYPVRGGAYPWLSMPPADMGLMRLGLLHLDLSGHGLAQFPPALTQLVALKCLKASKNEFAELPAGFTALSKLTKLTLGRTLHWEADALQLHDQRPLDVRALGDLSGFPALCKLSFSRCEVTLCQSMLRAARHASLRKLTFCAAHPAPGCAPMMLQLSRALKELRRGSVLKVVDDNHSVACLVLGAAAHQRLQALQPFFKFIAALDACGLCEVPRLQVVHNGYMEPLE